MVSSMYSHGLTVKTMCQNKGDYCGPQVTKWRDGLWVAFVTRVLARAIPDNVYGICLSPACKAHDKGYTEGGHQADKDRIDLQFKYDIYTLVSTGLRKQEVSSKTAHRKATRVAELYYLGVRTKTAAKQFKWLRGEY